MEKLAEGYGLIEGPVWDPDRGLLFSDALLGVSSALARTGACRRCLPIVGGSVAWPCMKRGD